MASTHDLHGSFTVAATQFGCCPTCRYTISIEEFAKKECTFQRLLGEQTFQYHADIRISVTTIEGSGTTDVDYDYNKVTVYNCAELVT